MKRIVIFGATGAIGAYFTDYCFQKLDKSNFNLMAVGRKNTPFFSQQGISYSQVDLRVEEDFSRLPQENVYAVVNLAGLLPAHMAHDDPFAYVDVNISGGLRILEYARKTGADRILYTQTWAELAGYWGEQSVLSPAMPRRLRYTGDHAFYAISKTMMVETMEYYYQSYGLKRFVFRLPNIYMYHPHKTYFVDGVEKQISYRYLIDQAMHGQDLELWGDPEAYKDVIYVKDLCQMMYKALFAPVDGGIYHAGTGRKTTMREQLEGIIDVFAPKGRTLHILLHPEKNSFDSFVMDIENARKDLGYVPEYDYLSYLRDYKREMERKHFDTLWET